MRRNARPRRGSIRWASFVPQRAGLYQEFAQPFIWRPGQTSVRVEFWVDEAVLKYWIGDVATCPGRPDYPPVARHLLSCFRRGMKRLRGHSRRPREAAAESSRPHSQTREGDAMPSITEITVAQFSRLIGLPQTPAIVDVRIDDDYRADPRMLPGSVRRHDRTIEQWAPKYQGMSVVVVCHKGQKLSEGTAAWLRHTGIEAQTLEVVSRPGKRPVSCWSAPTNCRNAMRRAARSGRRARARKSTVSPVPG